MIVYKISVLATLISLISCATPQIKNGEVTLDNNTAILITKLNERGYTHGELSSVLMSYDSTPGLIRAISFNQTKETLRYTKGENNINVIKVNTGKAWFSRIVYATKAEGFFDKKYVYHANIENDNPFMLEAGKINYIGDFNMETQGSKLRTTYTDNESYTVQEAKKMYPDLFIKYEYVKNIPNNN